MSLINDALRKAQRERTGHPGAPSAPPADAGTPPSSTPPPTATAPTYRPAPKGGMGMGAIAGIIVALVIGGGAVWWVMRPSASNAPTAGVTVATTPAPTGTTSPGAAAATPAVTPSAAPTSTATAVAQPPPVAPVPAPVTPVPATPGPLDLRINVPTVAVNPPPTSAPAPVQSAAVNPAPSTPAPAATELHPALNPAAAVSGGTEDPRILAFLDSAHIGGIRASLDDARLLMNNRVFRAGDMVDRPLKLRLTKIEPGKLTFTDERGTIYLKEI